mgnify:CR=1 FL=1
MGEFWFLFEQDKHYDYNYQQSRELPREVTIFPEDELVTECSYNTANQTYPIRVSIICFILLTNIFKSVMTILYSFLQTGNSMKQETCLAYITYYPKISLTSCQSMTPIKSFFQNFAVREFYDYDVETIEKVFSQVME